MIVRFWLVEVFCLTEVTISMELLLPVSD